MPAPAPTPARDRKRRLLIGLPLAVVALVGLMLAGELAKQHLTPDGSLIVNAGTFPSPDGEWVVSVKRLLKSRITYDIRPAADEDTDKRFAPRKHFSNYRAWALYWQSETELWCHSSDVGPSVWLRDESTGDWVQHWVSPKASRQIAVPAPLRVYLDLNDEQTTVGIEPADRALAPSD